MTDYTELKRLAEAFPAGLDWDSNTEPFFNGLSGESLGGGPTGFYCVYGPAFDIDGDQYDGPTYVETCKADFAKFMVAARDGVLALIAENERVKARLCVCRDCGGQGEVYSGHSSYQGHNQPPEPDMDVCGTCGGDGVLGPLEDFEALAAERDQLCAEVAGLRTGYEAYERVNAELKAENERLERNRDMWKGQVDRQCETIEGLRKALKAAEDAMWHADGNMDGEAADARDALAALGQGEQS